MVARNVIGKTAKCLLHSCGKHCGARKPKRPLNDGKQCLMKDSMKYHITIVSQGWYVVQGLWSLVAERISARL